MAYEFEKELNEPQNYYWFKNGLSQEDLDRLTKQLESISFEKATIIGQNADVTEDRKDVRSSRIKWIPQSDEWKWLFDILMPLIVEANNEMWKFDLQSADESIQYTEYLASEDGHYDWHQDVGPGFPSLRKVSLTIQLSDANEYDGGDLEIWPGGSNIWKTPRGAGRVVIFPSYMMHRVSPVTRGVRKSLVLWVGGSHYK